MKSRTAKVYQNLAVFIAIAAMAWLAILSNKAPSPPLPNLVKSITETFEASDYEAFCRLVDGESPTKEMFRSLVAQNKYLDYNELFKRQYAQADKETFTLGGHEYGHLHMDFVEGDSGWRLAKVWMCR